MSADNYYLVRKIDGRFIVTMGFMSDENVPPRRGGDPNFPTLLDAINYAEAEYSEYGIRIDASAREVECNCDFCRRCKRFETAKASRDTDQLIAIVEELLVENCNLGEDNNYYEAIRDGSWPHAELMLHRWLARVQLKNAPPVSASSPSAIGGTRE